MTHKKDITISKDLEYDEFYMASTSICIVCWKE